MEPSYACCCGLDVHKKTVAAYLISPGAEGVPQKQVRTFGTMTGVLLALADWLEAAGCTHVAMESTGGDWQPIWNLLEDRFTLLLVNARHIKVVPGRKTDVRDCEWIGDLLRHGLLQASVVPPRPQRELRELTRYRTSLARERAAEAHSLALSPDGQRLAVVDASSGASIAIVNTETLQVVETRPKNAPGAYRPGSPTALAAGRDGTLYLPTGQELIALTRQGHVAYRHDLGEPIHALELSGDGVYLFAVSAGRLNVIDAASGDRAAAFALEHVDGFALTAPATNGIAAPSRLTP